MHGDSLAIGLTDNLYLQIRLILRQLGARECELTTAVSMHEYFGTMGLAHSPGVSPTFHNASVPFRGAPGGMSDVWQVSRYEEGDFLDQYILRQRAAGMHCSDPDFLAPLIDLSAVRTAVNGIDGLLLAGGDDINPLLYAPQNSGSGKQHRTRDIIELAFIQETLAQSKPILAICRAAQLLAVALGAALIQDIPAERPGLGTRHSQPQEWDKSNGHAVGIAVDSAFSHILDLDPRMARGGLIALNVNSYHHQAVLQETPAIQTQAWDLVDEATPSKGIIEGFVGRDATFVVGVQWHPERPLARRKDEPASAIFAPDLLLPTARPHDRALFRSFLAACHARRG